MHVIETFVPLKAAVVPTARASGPPGPSGPPPVPSVVVHDDHVMFAAGLADVLARDGADVLAYTPVRESVVALVGALLPTVCLVGTTRFGREARGMVADVRRVSPSTRVVLAVARVDDELWRAWDRGDVAAVVSKQGRLDDLLRAVRRAGQGHRSVIGLSRPAPDRGTPLGSLTAREAEVLRLVVAGASTREMSERLDISVNTVRTHVQHLLDKLGVRTRVQLARAAHEHDLVGADG